MFFNDSLRQDGNLNFGDGIDININNTNSNTNSNMNNNFNMNSDMNSSVDMGFDGNPIIEAGRERVVQRNIFHEVRHA